MSRALWLVYGSVLALWVLLVVALALPYALYAAWRDGIRLGWKDDEGR